MESTPESQRKKRSFKNASKKDASTTKKEKLNQLALKRERERIRRAQIKNDPQKYEEQRQKEKERYLKRKAEGKIKLIDDLSDRDKRAKRKKWNENNKRYRERIKKNKELTAKLMSETPPASPPNDLENREILNKVNESKQRAGRKRVARNKTASYRKICSQKRTIQHLERKLDSYKKKYSRYKQKMEKKLEDITNNELTPLTKVEQLTKGIEVPKEVKRKLLFSECIQKQLSDNFKQLKDDRSKQIFTKVVNGRILKKYRLLNMSTSFLPYKYYHSNISRKPLYLAYERKNKSSLKYLQREVQQFLENNENSRLCPGKKECITFRKIKKQKRYLNYSLKVLFKKFSHQSTLKISYSTFCRLRPFWVVPPKLGARDTCLCMTHENFKLMVEKLHQLHVVPVRDPEDLLDALTCNKTKEACLIRECDLCKEKVIHFKEFDGDQMCSYQKWCTKKESRISAKTKKNITVQLTLKQDTEISLYLLVKELQDRLPKYMNHVRNVLHQHRALTKIKNSLRNTEMLIHVDFAENYSCKYFAEAQSVHFGASRQQITLHTGVMYTNNSVQSFCTLSTSLRHDPRAIAAHLIPMIKIFLRQYPDVDTIYFASDSPSTQYRNKIMFALMTTFIPRLFPSVTNISWNYSESGHGKGAPDGIGATLKRTADRLVCEHKDVHNFTEFLNVVKENVKGIIIETVSEDDIMSIDKEFPVENIPVVKGTMNVHNFMWTRTSNLTTFNSLTCNECTFEQVCKHYNIVSKILQSNAGITNTDAKDLKITMNTSSGLIYKINDWVAVLYEDNWYPGKVCWKRIIFEMWGQRSTHAFS